MNFLVTATEGAAGGSLMMIAWIVILFVLLYFMMIRPQRKEQSRKQQMLSNLEIGDTILTTSGFYGTIVDVQDDMVIVEFGSNKNCRIPMQQGAIADVEKPADSVKVEDNPKDKKKNKGNV